MYPLSSQYYPTLNWLKHALPAKQHKIKSRHLLSQRKEITPALQGSNFTIYDNKITTTNQHQK